MRVVVAVLVLALLFAAVGIIIEALRWALIIALALVLLGMLAGFRGRGRAGV